MLLASKTEARPDDMLIGPVTLGDQIDEFYQAYINDASEYTDAKLFMVNNCMYARGSKSAKRLAWAYFCGWRARAGCEVPE